eukprot:scaffold449_cov184-Amphora_coffeaeformis.AAC.16
MKRAAPDRFGTQSNRYGFATNRVHVHDTRTLHQGRATLQQHDDQEPRQLCVWITDRSRVWYLPGPLHYPN